MGYCCRCDCQECRSIRRDRDLQDFWAYSSWDYDDGYRQSDYEDYYDPYEYDYEEPDDDWSEYEYTYRLEEDDSLPEDDSWLSANFKHGASHANRHTSKRKKRNYLRPAAERKKFKRQLNLTTLVLVIPRF